MIKKYFTLILLAPLLFSACNSDKTIVTYKDIEKDLQTQFILAENGSTISIPAGHFLFKGSLSLEGKDSITIEGAGMDSTVLSFKSQTVGAEGITVTNGKHITIKNLTVQDTKGDGIKTRKVDGIQFINLKTEWTGEPSETNGAYGLYPVDCDRVIVDGCIAIGASDAGIYVGQSRQVIVRNCTAIHNVAGIEIENCQYAEVYNNYATENTGGLLIFDMPDLSQSGHHVRAYDNYIYENNYRNFAPEGNIVGTVPPGTGMMVVATNYIEAFNNRIINNKTQSMGIVSFYMSGFPIKDSTFNPYPQSIYIHDNVFERKFTLPSLKSKIGKMIALKFGFWVPHILYDGIINPETIDENGDVKDVYKICFSNNTNQTFANLDAENEFKNVSRDISTYLCDREQLQENSLK